MYHYTKVTSICAIDGYLFHRCLKWHRGDSHFIPSFYAFCYQPYMHMYSIHNLRNFCSSVVVSVIQIYRQLYEFIESTTKRWHSTVENFSHRKIEKFPTCFACSLNWCFPWATNEFVLSLLFFFLFSLSLDHRLPHTQSYAHTQSIRMCTSTCIMVASIGMYGCKPHANDGVDFNGVHHVCLVNTLCHLEHSSHSSHGRTPNACLGMAWLNRNISRTSTCYKVTRSMVFGSKMLA